MNPYESTLIQKYFVYIYKSTLIQMNSYESKI